MAHADRSTVGFTTRSSQIDGASELGAMSSSLSEPVAYERHQLSWTQAYGERSSSSIKAQYVD